MSWKCENCGELNDDEVHRECWKCKRGERVGYGLSSNPSLEKKEPDRPERTIMCSTTIEIPGREVVESKGIVFGEAILGANIFRDLLAGVRDIVGGRSGAYESKLRTGREIAVIEMLHEAQRLGADAVVGIDIDFETVGQTQTMLMICASGTAVTLKPLS